jgi:hypothetical protein
VIFGTTTPTSGDTHILLWKKALQVIQTRPGALPTNNPATTDSLRTTLAKVLCALQGINYLSP